MSRGARWPTPAGSAADPTSTSSPYSTRRPLGSSEAPEATKAASAAGLSESASAALPALSALSALAPSVLT